MNIVFLVHYFPPLNSTGARRVLAFSKYLHRMGHTIHVVTTVKSNKDGLLSEQIPDYCNLVEVSWWKSRPSLESKGDIAVKVGNRSKLGSMLIKIKRWIMKYSGQLIDHRLLFSLYFFNPFLPKSLKKIIDGSDIIISSCPPWPVHLAGLICALRFRKKWLADYRDQFSGNHVFIGNKVTRFLEVQVEKWLLKVAAGVVVISEPMKDYYLKFNKNVYCIENGYDEEQFSTIKSMLSDPTMDNNLLYIRYMGNITRYRVPEIFFTALSMVEKTLRDKIIVEFYGESDPAKAVLQTTFPQLIDNVKFMGIVSHEKSICLMLEADALLFQETTAFSKSFSHSSRGSMSAKLFEYLAAQKPIIAEVEPENLMGQAIMQSGLCCSCTLDAQEMCQSILYWLSHRDFVKPNLDYISRFSRKSQAYALEQAINNTLQ